MDRPVKDSMIFTVPVDQNQRPALSDHLVKDVYFSFPLFAVLIQVLFFMLHPPHFQISMHVIAESP